MMPFSYEWDVEEVTSIDSEHYEKGEVLDHWHQDSYADCIKFVQTCSPPEGVEYRIVLVMDVVSSSTTSVVDRAWAYVEDGEIVDHFYDAEGKRFHPVPKRFLAEVRRNHGTHKQPMHPDDLKSQSNSIVSI